MKGELTTPQQRILNAIRDAGRPVAASHINVASPTYTTACIRMFRDMGLIYVGGWRKVKGNNGLYPLFMFGRAPDVAKPIADKAELRRRKNARDREMHKRQMAEKANVLPPSPTMPEFMQYGYWGI